MISLISGENNFESKQALDQAIEKYSQKGLEIHKAYPSEEESFQRLLLASDSLGLFGSKSATVIKFIEEANAGQMESIIDLAERGVEVLLYASKSFDKRSRLYKYVKKNGKVQEFPQLKGAQLQKWLFEEIRLRNIQVSRDILMQLVFRVGEIQSILAFELDKLEALSREDIEITKEVIEEVAVNTIETDIWKLIDSLAGAQKAKSFRLLDILTINIEYENIFALIARQLRLLFMGVNSNSAQEISAFGVHPFVASKIYSSASRYSNSRLTKLYSKLVDMDIAVKSGQLDKNVALDMLIMIF